MNQIGDKVPSLLLRPPIHIHKKGKSYLSNNGSCQGTEDRVEGRIILEQTILNYLSRDKTHSLVSINVLPLHFLFQFNIDS